MSPAAAAPASRRFSSDRRVEGLDEFDPEPDYLMDALHLVMSHSCSVALWNFQVRFGPAITLR